jgi:Predicted nucleotidyltransferases
LNIEQLKPKLEALKPQLIERYKVETIGFFGSYVRGEQKTTSDLDILVSFTEAPSLFGFIELEDFLSQQLGVKVDLVMKDSLKPRIKSSILQEAVYI